MPPPGEAMNWLGFVALLLLCNTVLIAALLSVFVVHHFYDVKERGGGGDAATPPPPPPPPPLPDPLLFPSNLGASSACPVCGLGEVTETLTTTVTTSITTSSTLASYPESLALLFRLLDAYLNGQNAPHAPSTTSTAEVTTPLAVPVIQSVGEISAFEELLAKLQLAEREEETRMRGERRYEERTGYEAPPYPIASSDVCGHQKDVESSVKCEAWRLQGFCESNPSTLHLLCKKSCLCSAVARARRTQKKKRKEKH